jgi:Protein of unknown function (DUF5818)
MPRGTRHMLDGLLLAGHTYPVLRADGGGEWQLDLPVRLRKFIGRRVRVTGTRSEFDMLDVTEVTAI